MQEIRLIVVERTGFEIPFEYHLSLCQFVFFHKLKVCRVDVGIFVQEIEYPKIGV
jgi:hypothetical protein